MLNFYISTNKFKSESYSAFNCNVLHSKVPFTYLLFYKVTFFKVTFQVLFFNKKIIIKLKKYKIFKILYPFKTNLHRNRKF